MDISRISLIIQQMNEIIVNQNTTQKELTAAMQELAGIQKRIASLEQDLLNSEKEYSFLDERLRPEIAVYLKNKHEPYNHDRILA